MTDENTIAKNYQALAAAIVEVACADYIDAQILNIHRDPTEQKYRQMAFDEVINYGAKRYVYKEKGKLIRQTEKDIRGLNEKGKMTVIHRGNRSTCKKIKRILESKDEVYKRAQAEIDEIERFFRSDLMHIYTPSIDAERLIEILKKRAENEDRMKPQCLAGR